MYLEHESTSVRQGSWRMAANQLIAKANDHTSQAGALEAVVSTSSEMSHDRKFVNRRILSQLNEIARLERELSDALLQGVKLLDERDGLK